ncbi:AbgT family transporter [Flavobacterium sp. MXW15]|uniref:AbgT family transporter n=1 Tax=Xanthomonas chitinilytica TaxID=2989819 RepID=A0ABT3JWK7_9XANT|nr:AbgT family transporter [Xanthomonas sp. H13-6]MCW4455636.1 AbgT family transporter [Flavobacterium sp. MXW15]MCW4472878.1 AbgT family transporter [Xanthomonas sp. H13-6]
MNTPAAPPATGLMARFLDFIERTGNRLPDPAALFLLLMLAVWGLSWALSGVDFAAVDPRSGEPIRIVNLLAGDSLTGFMANMVKVFLGFAPLGVVLVAMLGLGVAEHTGFINAALRRALSVTPRLLLTPALVAVAVLSHVAVDAGYVLVIPLGGVIFYAAGRHPIAGIAAAFCGVSGGFSATLFVPSSLDPMLATFTQSAAQILDPALVVNPLNNWLFTTASSFLVIAIGWFVTDRIVEPRLARMAVDGDTRELPKMEPLSAAERRGLGWALAAMALAGLLFALSLLPEASPWRAPAAAVPEGSHPLLVAAAPVMQSIVALIFVFFLLPGVVYGYVAGTVKSHRDIIAAMTKAMSGMGYYIVIAFFIAQFLAGFNGSGLGTLMAVEGADLLKALGLPMWLTIIGLIVMTAIVNLFIGSASAKWALLAPIMVPLMMQLGVSPDLTQAAYRVGDSMTTILTPLMPYFPLIVVFCQRYVTSAGIGTLVSVMVPYSIALSVLWTLFLLAFWALGVPLGVGASYGYPAS